LKLLLAIRSYEPNAVFDHFEGGAFEAFDVVTAEVVNGPKAGQVLSILVETGSTLAARWNRPGETLRTSIEFGLLDSQIIFAGAFKFEDGT
jgi:hypothetical protein